MKGRSLAAVLLAGLMVSLCAHAQSGPNVTVSWQAPTTNTDGSPIAGAITYNLYAASCSSCPCVGATFTEIATGITATSSLRTAITPTIHGYTVTAVVNGVESDQAVPACIDASQPIPPASPKKPSAPSAVTITSSP